MTPGRRLSAAQARRIALAAQGFGRRRPATVTGRHVQAVIDSVAQFQIDTINVTVRAHYAPLFARLGPYDRGLLDRAADTAPRRLFEYWGHAASLLDVELQPYLRWAMRRRAQQPGADVRRILASKPELVDRILADLASGPLTARSVDNVEERRREHWGWNWSEAKHVLEYLFDSGRVAVAGRNAQFERRYGLAEDVLPAAVLAVPDPSQAGSHDALVRRAARALGVADVGALATYFYLKRAPVAAAVARLARAGELEPVEIEGLDRPHWLWHEAAVPRSLSAQALVGPFDSLVFDRRRLLDLFGVHYRIETYTPAARRRYGYYVYLVLSGDTFVARVDLKADRTRGVLLVPSAWSEEGARPDAVAPRLAAELRSLASWLGLTDVAAVPAGTLGERLVRALA
nr:winged helix-turn-helix domain-containing protein [Propionibacterium sp.]